MSYQPNPINTLPVNIPTDNDALNWSMAGTSSKAFLPNAASAYQQEREAYTLASDLYTPKNSFELAAESADTYRDFQYNLRNNDPNAARKQELESASERNRRILAGQQLENERKYKRLAQIGSQEYADDVMRKDNILNTLSGSERLDNYLRRQKGDPNTIDDPQFEQDIITKDTKFIEALYGIEAASYAYQEQKKRFGAINDATNRKSLSDGDRDFLSWDNLKDSSLSILAKTAESIGSLQNATSIVSKVQSVLDVNQTNSIWDTIAETVRDARTDAYKRAEIRESGRDTLTSLNENLDIVLNRQAGQDEKVARNNAENSATFNTVMDLFSEDSTFMAKASEIIGDVAVGGIVAKGAVKLAEGVSKAVVKSYVEKQIKNKIKDVATNSAKRVTASTAIGSKADDAVQAGITKSIPKGNTTIQGKTGGELKDNFLKARAIERQNQVTKQLSEKFKDVPEEITSKISNKVSNLVATGAVTVHAANQEAMQALKEGYDLVVNMDNNTFGSTVKGKEVISKLNEKFQVTSFEEGMQDPKYVKEFKSAKEDLASEASVNAYQSVFQTSSAINVFTSGLEKRLAGVGNRATSFKQHAKNFLNSTGKETVEEFGESYVGDYQPKNQTNRVLGTEVFDADKTALASGIKGAITAAVGTAGLNALPLGASSAKKASQLATKAINKLNQKEEEKEHIKAKEETATKFASVFGSSEGKDSEGNIIPAQKGILGTTFDESNFGKTYKKIEDSINQLEDNHPVKKVFNDIGSKNYTEVIDTLHKQYVNNIDILTNSESTEEQKAQALNEIDVFESIQHELTQSINRDLGHSSNTIHQAYKELSNITKKIANASPEEQDILIPQREAMVVGIQKLIEASPKYEELQKTTIFRQLERTTSLEQVREAGHLQRDPTLADNFKGKTLGDIYNKISTNISTVKQKIKDKHLSQTDLQNLSKSLFENITEAKLLTKDKSSSEVIKDLRNIFSEVTDTLNQSSYEFAEQGVWKELSKVLNNHEEFSKYGSDVFIQKFFGGYDSNSRYMKGLLDYMSSYFTARKNGTGFQELAQLQKFIESQQKKAFAMSKLIGRMKHENPQAKLNTKLKPYTAEFETDTLSGEPRTFESIQKAMNYYNMVQKESEVFHNLANKIITGTLPTKVFEVKNKDKQVKPNTVNEPIKDNSVSQLSKVKLSTDNPNARRYLPKDQKKSDKANKFIGFGTPKSSTDSYRRVWESVGKANTGKYSKEDKVFVSHNGGKNVTNLNFGVKKELDLAIKAGSTIITDNVKDRGRDFNTGERLVAKYLEDNGYKESNGNGVWVKDTNTTESTVRTPRESTERSTERNVPVETVKEPETKQVATKDTSVNTPLVPEIKNGKLNIWHDSNENSALSNKAYRPFTYKGKDYVSVEHAYQTLKSGKFDENTYNKPWKDGSKFVGLNADLSDTEELMEGLIRTSLESNPEIKQLLIDTGSVEITHTQDKGHWKTAFPEILTKIRNDLQGNTTEEISVEQVTDQPSKSLTEVHKSNVEKLRNNALQSFMFVSDNMIKYALGFSKDTIQYEVDIDKRFLDKIGTGKGQRQVNKNTVIKGNKAYLSIPSYLVKSYVESGLSLEGRDILSEGITEKPMNEYETNIIKVLQNQDSNTIEIANALNDGTLDDKYSGTDKLFAEQIKTLFSNLSTYLEGKQLLTPMTFFKETYALENRFGMFNAVFNFFNVEQQNQGKSTDTKFNVSIPVQLLKGALFSVAKEIPINHQRLATNKLNDHYQNQGFEVFDIRNISKLLKTKYMAQILNESGEFRELEDYESSHTKQPLQGVGVLRKDFIESLGESFLRNTGIKLKNNLPQHTIETITYSFGDLLFKFLESNNLVNTYVVQVRHPDSRSFSHVYTNYSFNDISQFNKKEKSQINLLLGNWQTQDESQYSEAIKDLTKNYGSTFTSVLQLIRGAYSDLSTAMLGSITEAQGVVISSIDDEKGTNTTDNKGIEVERKDTQVKLTTGNSKVLKDAVKALNNVPFVVDEHIHQLNEANPEMFRILSGGLPSNVDIDKLDISEDSKDIYRSKELRVTRSLEILNNYIQLAKVQVGDVSKAIFRIKHRLIPNARLQQSGTLQPQSDKIAREYLNTAEFKIEQNEDGTGNIKGIIQSKIKTPAVKNQRTIESLLKKADRDPETKSFVLALAQGIGIKIEKLTYPNVIAQLKTELNKEDTKYLTDLLWKQSLSDKPIEFDSNKLHQIAERKGTAISRYTKALKLFAIYQNQNTEKEDPLYKSKKRSSFNSFLYIEADGIANGFYNILKQFTVGFTKEYIHSMKRVGEASLDEIALLSKGKSAQEIEDSSEGSAHLFENRDIKDMYEHIAIASHETLQNSFKAIPSFVREHIVEFLTDEKYLGIDDLFDPKDKTGEQLKIKINTLIKQEYPENQEYRKFLRKEISQSINALKTYGQIYVLGALEGEAKANRNKYIKAIRSGDFTELMNDGIPTFKRALAKLGVTPKMYGGGLDGVTNQILTELKPALLTYVDKVFTEIANAEQGKEENFASALNDLRTVGSILGLKSPLIFKNGKLNYDPVYITKESGKAIRKQLNDIVENFTTNRKRINESIKNGLGKLLNTTIATEYKVQLSGLELATTAGQTIFNVFINDFIQTTKKVLKQKQKGLSEEQKLESLTKQEILDILKSLTTIPVIATAYSNNAQLLDTLMNVGTALVKEANNSKDVKHVTVASGYGTKFKHGKNYVTSNNRSTFFHSNLNYEAAGAASNTYVIPSTEAMTLNLVQQTIQEAGKAFLSVFDGLDANYSLRELVGKLANSSTAEVHANANLFEGFFQLMNRSELVDILKNTLVPFSEVVDDDTDHNPVHTSSLLKEDIRFTLLAMKLKLMEINNEVGFGDLEYFNKAKQAVAVIRKNLNKLIQGSLAAGDDITNLGVFLSLEEFFQGGNDIEEAISQAFESLSANLDLISNVPSSFSIEDLHYDVMSGFRELVANNYATRQLQDKDLPVLIAQFGGSNGGYLLNKEVLDNTNILDRWNAFLESNGVTSTDPEILTENLVKFIKSDEQLVSKYNKYKNQKLKELKINTPYTPNYEKQMKSIKTFKDVQDLLNNPEVSTMSAEVGKLVSELSNNITTLTPDTKVYTDLDEFVKDVKEYFNIDERTKKGKAQLKELYKETDGKYAGHGFMYINPNAHPSNMVHELLHSMNRGFFSKYYSELRNTLPVAVRTAIKHIETNALRFANNLMQDPDVASLVQELRDRYINEAINGKEYYDDLFALKRFRGSPVKGTAVNLLLAFSDYDTSNRTLHNQMMKNRQRALDEFVAYGLSEAQMLRVLSSRQGVKFGESIVSENGTLIRKSTVRNLANYYSQQEQQITVMFGTNRQTNDANNSILINLLSSYKLLSDYVVAHKDITIVEPTPITEPRGQLELELEINNSISSTSGRSINSQEHKDYLTEFTRNIISGLHSSGITENFKAEAYVVVKHDGDSQGMSYISDIRSSGIPMSIQEENAYLLSFAANKVNLLNNKELESSAYRWASDLVQLIDARNLGISNENFSKLFNLNQDGLSHLLALASTNEYFRNKLNNISTTAKESGLRDRIFTSLSYLKTYNKDISTTQNLKQGADVIATAVASFNFKDGVSQKEKERQFKDLFEKEKRRQQLLDSVGELTSEHISSLLKGLTSGQGKLSDNRDNDSLFTEAVNTWINNFEKKKGRRTLIGSVVRLFVGSTSKTYQWYKLKDQNSGLLEQMRERNTVGIPEAIRSKFETLTDREEQAINKVLLPTNMNRLTQVDLIKEIDLLSILENEKNVVYYKEQLQSNLLDTLVEDYGQKEGVKQFNIMLWQIKGLAELQTTKQSKTHNINHASYIMPNTRAITNLLPNKADRDLQSIVNSLTALYALDYVPNEDKQVLGELYRREEEAFEELLDSVDLLESMSIQKSNLMGEDGFQMKKRDPLSTIQIVDPKDSEMLQNLKIRGFTQKAKLPTGHLVMHTSMSDSVRFTTGMFNLTETTNGGVNITTGKSIGSFGMLQQSDIARTIPQQVLNQAGKSDTYYDNLTETTSKRIVINYKGDIKDTMIDLPISLEEQLIESNEYGINAIGNYTGRTLEEKTNITSNKYAIDNLRAHYANKYKDRKYFIPFDGNYKPKGKSVTDVRFAEQVNSIYHSLPEETKAYISSTGGVMIDLREVENILGYNQASVTDLWNERSKLPQPVQHIFKTMFEVLAAGTGMSPVKLAKYFEQVSSELASFTKDVILIKNVFVPLGNLVSNALHLWTAGVPINKIKPLMQEGLALAKDYQKTQNRLAGLEFLSLNRRLAPSEKVKLDLEIKLLKEKLLKSSIRPLVDNGIFNSVTTLEVGDVSDVDYSLLKRFQDKLGITKLNESLQDNKAKKAIDNVLIRQGSDVHNFMVQTMDYGDFVAKYALYQHLTKNKGIPTENAMEVIRDEFVNYTMNRGREFDWANRVGLTWFLAYKTAIQKIIFRNLRRNFLRTLGTWSIGKTLPDNPILDKTVIEQNVLIDSSLGYQLDPTNLVTQASEAYFWTNLLK